MGGAARVEPTLDFGYGYFRGGDDRAQFPCPPNAIGSGGPNVQSGRKGRGTYLRRRSGRELIPTRNRDGRRLHVAPEVDTSKVLVPDSTKPEDDEVLYLDDRFDTAVTAPGGVLFLKDGCWGEVSCERFRDGIFHGILWGAVSKQRVR